ncbi:MAG: hypothetical protein EBZ48_04610 [Proteobacteria bacterium]|nr:hypothetical protein [Pseudomonadota bacterium]
MICPMNSAPQNSVETLPLFPLPLAIFPGELIPLHIFEERFKDLVRDCIGPELDTENGTHFGISLTEQRSIRPIGCAVRIERVLKAYPDGKLDIAVVGTTRYEMVSIVQEKSYPEITVRFFFDEPGITDFHKREHVIATHIRLIELAKGRPPHLNYPSEADLSFILGHEAGLDLPQRQALIEMRSENARLDYLMQYYQSVIPALEERVDVKERIQANGFLRRFPGELL